MATNIFSNITQKGTLAAFHQAMSAVPTIWKNHCMIVPSSAAAETYVWPGMLPKPREFLNGRSFQGIRDFTYSVTNKTYELTFKIDRTSHEDDQHALIDARIREAAEAWEQYKDELFAYYVYEGDTLTTTYDSTAFHSGSRTEGASGTIDNQLYDSSISSATNPTSAEVLSVIRQCINALARFKDDQGRIMTTTAMTKLRLIIPPEFVKAVTEALNSTIISQSDNPWGRGICEMDVLPYLQAITTDTAFFMSAVGASRMPFIFQERTPLEVLVDNNPVSVAKEDGVICLCRQRYVFAYGEPRYNTRMDIA